MKDVLDRAAVVGPFDPLKLLPDSLEPTGAAAVLRQLGQSSDEVIVNGAPLWRLKPAERQRILAAIPDAWAARRLIDQTPPSKTDAFGRALQAALVGRDTATLPDPEDLEAAYSARSFAAAVPFAAKRKAADPGQVRSRIATLQEEKRRRIVLPHGLYGRDRVRNRIRDFIRGADPAGSNAMLVTGVGGIGKSALLTSILSAAERDPTSPPVIVLDFDRPNLYRCDRIEIAREITRQLGRHAPHLEQALHEARAQFPTEETTTEQSLYLRQQDQVLSFMRTALQPSGKKATSSRPDEIAVFLDTFEQVIGRGAQIVRDTLDWFDALRESGGLGKMRLLVSGRSAPDLPKDEMERRFGAPVDLKGLSPAAGAQLLREDALGRSLFSREKAQQASKALLGHPQALRLLKLYSKDHPETIDETIRDGLKESKFGIAFAQVFLYTRILGRIDDKDVAQLAHPGLTLRRVTPDLIRNVLAGPCEIRDVDEAKARDLFQRLAKTWVVDRTDDPDVVVHKRELRRLMLPGMLNPNQPDSGKVKLRGKAIEISGLAADWYSTGRDAKLDQDLQRVEAFYHRAIAQPEAVTVTEVIDFAPRLGEDFADLPRRLQVMRTVLDGGSSSVTPEEADLLPADLRDQWRKATETQALKSGDTSQVERAIFNMPNLVEDGIGSFLGGNPPPSGFADAEAMYGSEIHAWWADNRLQQVDVVANRVFAPLWQQGSHEHVIESRSDPVYFAAWKGLLAKLVTGDWPEVLTRPDAVEHWRSVYQRPDRTPVSSSMISPADLHLTAVALAWRARTPSPGRDQQLAALAHGEKGVLQLTHVPSSSAFTLRSLQLFNPQAVPVFLSCRLLRLFTPTYARLILAGGELPPTDEAPPPGIDELSAHLVRPQVRKLLKAMRKGRAPLAALDNIAKQLGEVSIAWTPQWYGATERYHAGRLIELADPIQNALASVVHDTEALIWLAAIGGAAPIWPIEFEASAIRKSPPSDPRRFMAQLIDMADQCGLLVNLMDVARQLRPEDTAIAELHQLVQRAELVFHYRIPSAEEPSAGNAS